MFEICVRTMDGLDSDLPVDYVFQCIRYSMKYDTSQSLHQLLRVHFTDERLANSGAECAELLLDTVTDGTPEALRTMLCYIDDVFLDTETCKGGKSLLNKLLCKAIERGDPAMVENLLQRGACAKGYYAGKPLLHFAVCLGHLSVAETLMANGADIRSLDNKGNGIIHGIIASQPNDKAKLLHWLIKEGADIHHKSPSGKSLIHVAAASSSDVLQVLVENGCDVNIRDDVNNDTPLHAACALACPETIMTLVQNGAKFNLENAQGQTPLAKLLKFTQHVHDFHSKSRIGIARTLISFGFRMSSPKHVKIGRDKVHDRYTSLMRDVKTVPSLQNISRCAVIYALPTGIKTDRYIEALDIPHNLKNYLLFKDYTLQV